MRVSDKQKKFLKSVKRNKIFIKVVQFSILFLLIFLWEILARYEVINSFITSSPSKIILNINDLLLNVNLINHIILTL